MQFYNASGRYTIGNTTLHGGSANVGIADSSGTFTFTGCSITSPTAIAFNVSGSTATNTANVAYTGLITQANNYAAVSVANQRAAR